MVPTDLGAESDRHGTRAWHGARVVCRAQACEPFQHRRQSGMLGTRPGPALSLVLRANRSAPCRSGPGPRKRWMPGTASSSTQPERLKRGRPTLMRIRSGPTRALEARVRQEPDVTTRVMPVGAGHARGLRCETPHSGIEDGAPSQERGAFREPSFTGSWSCVGPTPERENEMVPMRAMPWSARFTAGFGVISAQSAPILRPCGFAN